ncbi:MAG: MBL fold metallo-hydrolase [Acholeplasmataceae bacterium]|nr:MAG: MBL fold metallo-hydrolase [Acholeplasmataceae bacterium]
MDIHILASGSKGNATVIRSGDIRLMIDAGISFPKIKQRMQQHKEELTQVKTLFLTHEHGDHIAGLKGLLKQGFIEEVFLTKGTYHALPADLIPLFPPRVHFIQNEVPVRWNGFVVTPFAVSHDAAEPVAFIFEENGKKVVHLTDTGYVDQSYHALLSDADLYLVEANHDPVKLMHSPRPFPLKKRILGERGHLSNEDAAWLVNRLVGKRKSVWIVTHISEDCNTALDIEEAIVRMFDDPTKVEVYYTTQDGLPVITL